MKKNCKAILNKKVLSILDKLKKVIKLNREFLDCLIIGGFMKNLIKLFCLVITVSVIMLGCTDLNLNGTFIDKNNSEKCILTVSYAGDSVRTILPTQWDGKDLYYKIEGTSSRLYTLPATTLTFEDKDGTQQGTVALEYDDWNLTLKAYKDEDCTKQVLEGYAFADLTNGDTEITFTLRAKNLTTEGSLSIGGTYKDEESVVAKYTMTLKNFFTRATVKSEEVTSPADDGKFSFVSTDDVVPGTYFFEMRFFNANDKEIGYWGDEVIVDAGNLTTKNDLSIDVLMKKPTAPTNLKAYLVNDSEKDEYYNLKLVWEDTSLNEENFVLTIHEYDIDGNEIDYDSDVEDVQPYATLGKDFWKSPIRVDGSLLAGNNECVITLPTGRLFEVGIASENVVGTSDVCSRVDSSSDSLEGHTGLPVTNSIARVKITYNLNNGVLKFSKTDTGKSGSHIVYETYAGSDIPLITPITADVTTEPTEEAPSLIYNNQPFQKWVAEDGTDAVKTNKFENLYVTANFNSNYIMSYTIENHKELATDRVTATSTAGSNCINQAIARTEDEKITFKVVAEQENEPTYSQIKVLISGNENLSTKIVDGNLTAEIPLTSFATGYNTINVCAYDSTAGQWYSFTFNITVTQ